MHIRVLALLFIASIAAGCTAENPAFEPVTGPCADGENFVLQEFDVADPDKLDILFVVDNSAGMLGYQEALADALPGWVERLRSRPNLDWRAGVVSTDLAESQRGRLQRSRSDRPACAGDLPVIVSRNMGNASQILACNVILGEDGSDFEQGLEAARQAIRRAQTEEGTPNSAFLRADARLLILFVADEDDCTQNGSLDRSDTNNCVWQQQALVEIDAYQQYFSRVAKSRGGMPVAVASIVGPPVGERAIPPDEPEPVCDALSPALAGYRYAAISESVGSRGLVRSICATEFDGLLGEIFETLVAAGEDVICPARALSSPPVSIRLKEDGVESEDLEEYGDYLYLGATDECEAGAIALSDAAHGGDSGTQRVVVRFCTSEDVGG